MKLLSILLLAVAIGFSCSKGDPGKKGEPLPNIILILADDLGFSDIGCFGSEIHTPNLDSLALNGIRFTNMHNTSKCFPSRACLITGLYAQQNGYSENFNQALRNCITLGEGLKSAGYRTLWSGKHHGIENPVTRGFDRYYGLKDGATNYFNPGKQRSGEGKPAQKRSGRKWCIDSVEFAPYTPAEKDFYTTDYFTKAALNWLEEYREEEKPYFLFMAYNAPHDPLQAWPEDIKKYETRYKDGWAVLRKQRYQRQVELGLVDKSMPLSEPTYDDWDALDHAQKKVESRKMAVYAAMIDCMDRNIGRLLAKLKELGKEKNTLILFASDNGCSAEVVRLKNQTGEIGEMTRWTSLGANWANASNTPYRYFKNYSYEGGICTPLIAWWPGVIKRPGSITEHAGHFIDFMPTLMEVSGSPYPKVYKGQAITPYEGQSLVPALTGQSAVRKSPIFWQWSKGKAVLKGKWKLVVWGKKWELYDVEKDKTETKDLSAEHPEIVNELKSLHEKWLIHCAKAINK